MDARERPAAGGYVLVRPTDRKPWMSGLLPDRISSVSSCICEIGPSIYWGWEAGHWHDADAEAVVWADGLGIARGELPRLREWMIDADRRGDLEFRSVLASPDVARALVREFGVGTFIAEEDAQRGSSIAPTGIRTILDRAEAPVPGGQVLEYEVVGGGRSWICNGLERDVPDRFGIRPNSEGFISTRDDAERVAAWANDWDESHAEPEAWWSWLVSRYALT